MKIMFMLFENNKNNQPFNRKALISNDLIRNFIEMVRSL